jgi:hypothetical protein
MDIEPRGLTADERTVLDLLLSADVEGADALRQQAHGALVVGRCNCGCPTIDIHVPDNAAPRAVLSGRLWPVAGRVIPRDDAAPGQEVILFVDEGRLSSLELVFYTETPPAYWPLAADIELA